MKLKRQKARLKARQANYDATPRAEGAKKPGSMNPHKSFPVPGKKKRARR
jgi:hypothetical protein